MYVYTLTLHLFDEWVLRLSTYTKYITGNTLKIYQNYAFDCTVQSVHLIEFLCWNLLQDFDRGYKFHKILR
jgi:hypothetical protein